MPVQTTTGQSLSFGDDVWKLLVSVLLGPVSAPDGPPLPLRLLLAKAAMLRVTWANYFLLPIVKAGQPVEPVAPTLHLLLENQRQEMRSQTLHFLAAGLLVTQQHSPQPR